MIQKIETRLFLQGLRDIVVELSYDCRLERAWQLIQRNYVDSDLTLEKAARTAGVSKNHLNVLFRQTTTFTFHQFLLRYRLLMAINMMKTNNYTILGIALENGFGSLSGFERTFHRLIGITPKKFRDNPEF